MVEKLNHEHKRALFLGLIGAFMILTYFIFSIWVFNPHENVQESDSWENKKVRMETGVGQLVKDYSLIYCGMPNNERFAMSYNGTAACPVFYPISVKEFRIYNYHFRLEEVTPLYIKLTYLKSIKK